MHTVSRPAVTTDTDARVAGPVTVLGLRAAVTAPFAAAFAVAVGAPLYADKLSDAAGSNRFVIANAVTLGVLVLLTFALVAFYQYGERRLSRLGDVGFVIALAGTVLAAGGSWDSLFSVPYIADKAPVVLDEPTGGSLLAGFVVSYLVMVIGWVLFATAWRRAALSPRAASITLTVGAVLAIVPAPTALRLLPISIGAALVARSVLRSR